MGPLPLTALLGAAGSSDSIDRASKKIGGLAKSTIWLLLALLVGFFVIAYFIRRARAATLVAAPPPPRPISGPVGAIMEGPSNLISSLKWGARLASPIGWLLTDDAGVAKQRVPPARESKREARRAAGSAYEPLASWHRRQ